MSWWCSITAGRIWNHENHGHHAHLQTSAVNLLLRQAKWYAVDLEAQKAVIALAEPRPIRMKKRRTQG